MLIQNEAPQHNCVAYLYHSQYIYSLRTPTLLQKLEPRTHLVLCQVEVLPSARLFLLSSDRLCTVS